MTTNNRPFPKSTENIIRNNFSNNGSLTVKVHHITRKSRINKQVKCEGVILNFDIKYRK